MKEMPSRTYLPEWEAPENDDPDERLTQYARDHLVVRDNDFYDPSAMYE